MQIIKIVPPELQGITKLSQAPAPAQLAGFS